MNLNKLNLACIQEPPIYDNINNINMINNLNNITNYNNINLNNNNTNFYNNYLNNNNLNKNKLIKTTKDFNFIYCEKKELRPKSLIIIRKNSLSYLIDDELTDQNNVIILIDDLVLISTYFNLKENNNNIIIDRDIKKDLDYLKKILIKYKNKKIIICGDLNSWHYSWGNKSNKRGELLNDFINDNNLIIINEKKLGPTFKKIVKEQNSENISMRSSFIDLTLISSNLLNLEFDWNLRNDLINTEHSVIELRINKSIKSISISTKINYNKTNWFKFLDIFNKNRPKLNLNKNLKSSEYENTFYKFCKAIDKAFVRSVMVDNQLKFSNKWFDDELFNLKNELIKLRRNLFRSTKNKNNILIIYKSKRNDYYKLIKIKKSKYYESLLKVNNNEEFWKKWKWSNNIDQINIPLFEDNTTKTKEENDELLANHFIKKIDNKYEKLNLEIESTLPVLDDNELELLIKKLNNKKSPGIDNISNKIIKIIYKNEREYMNDLFNLILKKAKLPKAFKSSKMIYFKKPNKIIKSPKELRPISLLSGWCKIVEALFATRLENKLKEIKFFENNQFGFTKNLSTVDALNNIIKNIKSSLKKKRYTLLLCIDISGAFDGISWSLIMNNLIKSNLSNEYLKLVESTLIDRLIYLDNKLYESECGCPQGGRISPLLFKIGINSLLKDLNKLDNRSIITTAFADDVSILISTKKENEIQKLLNKIWLSISKWCFNANLSINKSKTELIKFGRKKIKIDLKLDDQNLIVKKEIKLLGLMLDSNLTWFKHLNYLENKIDQIINRIKVMRIKNVKFKFKKMIYNSVFLPTIKYSSEIWYKDIVNKSSYINKLNKINRMILLNLTGMYKTTPDDYMHYLTNTINIKEELDINLELNNLKKEDRREHKIKRRIIERDKIRNAFNDDLYKYIDFEQIEIKFTYWFLSNTGPFKHYLMKIGKVDEDICRYCNSDLESGHHLLFNCTQLINYKETGDLIIENMEKYCKDLAYKLFNF